MINKIKNYVLNFILNYNLKQIIMSEKSDDSVEYEIRLPFGMIWTGTWHDAFLEYGERVHK